MIARTLWAVAMLLLFLTPLVVPAVRDFFPAVVLAFGLLALHEAVALSRRRDLRISYLLSAACAVLLVTDARLTLLANGLVIVALYMIVLLGDRVWRADYRNVAAEVGAALLATLYVGLAMAVAVALMFMPGAAGESVGRWQIVFLIAVVFTGDSAAYVVGSRWGKRRFAPVLSPKKSLEGAVASVVVSILAAAVCAAAIGPLRRFYGVPHALAIGALLALAAPIGDLAESALKRDAGEKDSSHLIAGHGGFLDVFDALLFCVPIQYAYVQLVLI